jgi:Resolvase, N terminal domain
MPPINTGDRKELGKLLQSLAAGDQVLATRIDRLAQSVFELSPTLSSSASPVSRRALKFSLSRAALLRTIRLDRGWRHSLF